MNRINFSSSSNLEYLNAVSSKSNTTYTIPFTSYNIITNNAAIKALKYLQIDSSFLSAEAIKGADFWKVNDIPNLIVGCLLHYGNIPHDDSFGRDLVTIWPHYNLNSCVQTIIRTLTQMALLNKLTSEELAEWRWLLPNSSKYSSKVSAKILLTQTTVNIVNKAIFPSGQNMWDVFRVNYFTNTENVLITLFESETFRLEYDYLRAPGCVIISILNEWKAEEETLPPLKIRLGLEWIREFKNYSVNIEQVDTVLLASELDKIQQEYTAIKRRWFWNLWYDIGRERLNTLFSATNRFASNFDSEILKNLISRSIKPFVIGLTNVELFGYLTNEIYENNQRYGEITISGAFHSSSIKLKDCYNSTDCWSFDTEIKEETKKTTSTKEQIDFFVIAAICIIALVAMFFAYSVIGSTFKSSPSERDFKVVKKSEQKQLNYY